MKRIVTGARSWKVSLAIALIAVGCGDSSVNIERTEPEVIEDTTFAPSLDVDLGTMQELSTGVYIKDLRIGDGEMVAAGRVTVSYRGWLTNGTEFDSGRFDFLLGNDEVISGFEDGILGATIPHTMYVGGTRLLVIPPNRAYGSRASGRIPAGSVLVFEITADALESDGSAPYF